MLLRLVLLFTLVPLVELTLLMWLAKSTHWLFTLWLVILTGLAGAWLARQQGIRCVREVQQRLARGELPAYSLLEGLMILVAGVVLVTPGVLTDLVGFALLVPPFRRLVTRYLTRRISTRIFVSPPQAAERPNDRDTIIDAQVIDVKSSRVNSDDQERAGGRPGSFGD